MKDKSIITCKPIIKVSARGKFGEFCRTGEVDLVMLVFNGLMLPLPEDVLSEDVYRESDDCDAEAREEVGEHCAVGKYWVSPPGVTLGPWIE